MPGGSLSSAKKGAFEASPYSTPRGLSPASKVAAATPQSKPTSRSRSTTSRSRRKKTKRSRSLSPSPEDMSGVGGLEGELTASMSRLEGLREKLASGQQRPVVERKQLSLLGNPFQAPLNYWERRERRRAERRAFKARIATCKGIYTQKLPRRMPLPDDLLAVMNKKWKVEAHGLDGESEGGDSGGDDVDWASKDD